MPLAWRMSVATASPKAGGGGGLRKAEGVAAGVAGNRHDGNGLEGVLDGPPGAPLAEPAFRHLLAIERARADRAGRPLRMLTVSLDHGSRQAPLEPAVAARVFAGLGEAVRETDVIGWYRQDCVAAAVLIQPADVPNLDTVSVVLRRVGQAIEQRLSAHVAHKLDLRVVRVRQHPGNR